MKIASWLDPQRRKILLAKFRRIKTKLSVLLYVCGVALFLVLPHEDVCPKNYVDENALMPSYATMAFGLDGADSILEFDNTLSSFSGTRSLLEAVEREAGALGLESHRQNFSVSPPLGGDLVQGVNLYATLPAHRSAGMEALVLHVALEGGACNPVHSAAFALGMAKFFKSKVTWSKDIILLFTTSGVAGPQAWIQSYLGISNPDLRPSSLAVRSGTIIAAMSVELCSLNWEHLDVSTLGQNGLQPNQDILNALNVVARSNQVHLQFDGQRDSAHLPKSDTYRQNLKTVLQGLALQATGLQTGLHGSFVRYNIDAISVRTSGKGKNDRQQVVRLGRTIEGWYSSMNNLLERLHHSYYTYLTVSSHRFLSISVYLPPLALLLAVPLLDALEQWFVGSEASSIQSPSAGQSPSPLKYISVVWLHGVATGALLYTAPMVLHSLNALSDRTLMGILLSVLVGGATLPLPFRVSVSERSWRLLKFSLILPLATLLFALSVLNYSLAYLISAAIALPVMVAQPHRGSSLVQLIRLTALLVISPVGLSLLAVGGHLALFKLPQGSGVEQFAVLTWSLFKRGLSEVYLAHCLLHQWQFALITLVLTPCWMVLWTMTLHTAVH